MFADPVNADFRECDHADRDGATMWELSRRMVRETELFLSYALQLSEPRRLIERVSSRSCMSLCVEARLS
jgi:hypothetical protein